jgi:energy-converting hydrogenase A subunit R
MKRVMVNTDWEGPWVTADHAHAVLSEALPSGDALFERLSSVGVFFYYEGRRGYQPGDTLYMIAPFLIAAGKDESFLGKIAEKEAKYIDGAVTTLKLLDRLGYRPTIISTSYGQYVNHTVAPTGIPLERRFSTYFPLDYYAEKVSNVDKQLVLEAIPWILSKEVVSIDPTGKTPPSENDRRTSEEMYRFLFKQLMDTSFRDVMREIKPVGGERKTEALIRSLEQNRMDADQGITIGDSITDEHMLRTTKERGGLALAFNGNGYAVKEANIAVMADNCAVTALLVNAYGHGGHNFVNELADRWSLDYVRKKSACFDPDILDAFSQTYHLENEHFPRVVLVTPETLAATTDESKTWRRRVRGAVGNLG